MNLSLKYLQNHQYSREICIGLLLTAAFLVRCIFYSGGICGIDATAYAQIAHDIASGQYDLYTTNMFAGFRYSVLLPTALSFICFGVNDIAASIFPFIFSTLNIFVVFLITEKIFNRTMAVISSILLIFYPLDIMTANILLPDSFIPLLSSLAVLFFITAEEESSPASQRNLFLVLTGMLIALAYMSRVTSIFLFLSLAIFQIYHKKYESLIWITVGLLTPLAAEALYFYISTSDPLFEFHRITDLSIALTVKNDTDVSLLFYPRVMFGFDLTGLATFGLTWWLVVGGLLLAWLRKDNRMLLLSVCLIIPFFGFEFGFQSLKEGILIVKDYRYLSLLTGPAMIIGAYLLYHLLEFPRAEIRSKQFILVVSIVTLISMNLYGTYRLYQNTINDTAPYIAIADYLKKRPGGIIYTHNYLWPRFLGYFLQYDPSYIFRELNKMREIDTGGVSDTYIVLSKRHLEADVLGRPILHDSFAARFAKSPPPGWIKVLSFSGKPSYNSVALYHLRKE